MNRHIGDVTLVNRQLNVAFPFHIPRLFARCSFYEEIVVEIAWIMVRETEFNVDNSNLLGTQNEYHINYVELPRVYTLFYSNDK